MISSLAVLLYRASHGANNITSTPKVYETNGGGGGGSSYGGGCRPDTYYTKSGYQMLHISIYFSFFKYPGCT